MKFSFSLFPILILLLIVSCAKPIDLGEELVENDQSEIIFTDKVKLVTNSVPIDSILTYSVGEPHANMILANYSNPIFGKTKADIYARFGLVASNLYYPNFNDATLDSVVMRLYYEKKAIYGLPGESHTISITQLTDTIRYEEDYFSNQSIAVADNPIGEVELIPNLNDSLDIYYYSGKDVDTILSPPFIKINLDTEFGEGLMGLDSSVYVNPLEFFEQYAGLKISSEVENRAMLNIDINSPNSGVFLFYSRINEDGDTLHYNHQFYFGDYPRFENMKNDYSGALCEEFHETEEDSIVFLQGMAGYNVKIDFPNITDLADSVLVNKAILEFYVNDELADWEETDDYYSSKNVSLVYLEEDSNGDTTFLFVEDFINGLTSGTTDWFGGSLKETDGIKKYELNISNHIQKMIENKHPNSIFIRNYPKPTNFSSSILYGSSSHLKPRLKLFYTKIN